MPHALEGTRAVEHEVPNLPTQCKPALLPALAYTLTSSSSGLAVVLRLLYAGMGWMSGS